MSKQCGNVWCESPASQDNGLCFDCAEEMAVLIFDTFVSCGRSVEDAEAAAQASWKGEVMK